MTSAVFFVGRGKQAQFVGEIYTDGYPYDEHRRGIPLEVLQAATEEEFRKQAIKHVRSRNENGSIEENTTWQSATGFSYVYAFFKGHVWISARGPWFNDHIKSAPPKELPPAPLLRKGRVEGSDLRVVCGQCGIPEFIEIKNLLTGKARLLTITEYAEQRLGFKKFRQIGWVCRKCRKEH